MALRRVLPSRQPGAAAPEAKVVATPSPTQPSSPIAETSSSPLIAAEHAPAPIVSAESQLAAAASNAFATMQAPAVSAVAEPVIPAAPARVLEDSFTVSAPVAEITVTQPAVPVTAAAPMPEVSIPSVADFQPAQPQEEAPKPQEIPQPEPATLPQPVEIPAPSLQPEVQPVVPQPLPDPKPAPKPEPLPQPTPKREESRSQTNASRPDDNPMKRRVGGNQPGQRNGGNRQHEGQQGNRNDNSPVAAATQEHSPAPASQTATSAEAAPSAESPNRNRVKRQRDFAAATIAAPVEEKPRPSSGTAALAQNVPVNTRSLDKVDEELIASGIIAGPAKDSLTSGVPVSLAVAEEDHNSYPTRFDEPRDEPQSDQETSAPQSFVPEQAPVPVLPSPTAQPAFSSVPAQTESTPLPAVSSDLPWANASTGNGWEVELPPAVPEAEPTPVAAPNTPPADFFKPQAGGPGAAPSWASGGARTPPPELPGARGSRGPSMGRSGAPIWGLGLAGAGVAIIAFFIWSNSGQQTQLQEKVANWTGSLNDHSANPSVQGLENGVQPESTFSMAEFQPNGGLLPPPAAITPASSISSSAQIDFADVPPEQAGGPIIADGSESMPEDVSLFAKFQQAVAEARAKKQGGADVSGTQAVAEAPVAADGPLTPEKLKEELSAYRRSLTEAPDSQSAPKPTEIAKDPASYMDGKSVMAQGQLPPPVAADGKTASGALLPPPELYTNNPNNLPIVGEPIANAPARVRTLADFEVEPFEPEKAKVRIPRSLKPKMAATDFPTMQVLSYVPGRGIIAYTEGKEGVLLIGETMNGWELTNVTTELAEFRAGQKRHYITANE